MGDPQIAWRLRPISDWPDWSDHADHSNQFSSTRSPTASDANQRTNGRLPIRCPCVQLSSVDIQTPDSAHTPPPPDRPPPLPAAALARQTSYKQTADKKPPSIQRVCRRRRSRTGHETRTGGSRRAGADPGVDKRGELNRCTFWRLSGVSLDDLHDNMVQAKRRRGSSFTLRDRSMFVEAGFRAVN